MVNTIEWSVHGNIATVTIAISFCFCYSTASKIPLNQLAKMSAPVSSTASTSAAVGAAALHAGDMSAAVASINDVPPLTNIFVPLETIQPGNWYVETAVAIISEYHRRRLLVSCSWSLCILPLFIVFQSCIITVNNNWCIRLNVNHFIFFIYYISLT